jgi:hypothetical protein
MLHSLKYISQKPQSSSEGMLFEQLFVVICEFFEADPQRKRKFAPGQPDYAITLAKMSSETTEAALAIVHREEEYNARDANNAANDFNDNAEFPGENEAVDEAAEHQTNADNIAEAYNGSSDSA